MRSKREETENDRETTFDVGMDFFQAIRERNVTHGGVEVIKETTERFAETRARYDAYEYDDRRESTTTSEEYRTPEYRFTEGRSVPADRTEKSLRLEDDEESYDYEKLKVEYEQQLEYSVRSGKTLNYTETKEEAAEDTPRKALKRIMDLKRPENCTREELSQIGIKALECLAHDYRHAKDVATVKRLLSRTWLVLRVWLLIYVCLAIPCWCQRGWCCCCFRCKFCFPRKRILHAKQYYATNPPGTLVRDPKKAKEPVQYEATEYERDAYETLEAAIKNI